MKKIILGLFVLFAPLLADFVMKSDGTLTFQTTQDTISSSLPLVEGGSTNPPPADVEQVLPNKAFNVLDYGLTGDGKTDDSAALKELAKNTSVTNWYFPAGKSFLLTQITLPAHLEAIYGEGTVISKAYNGGTTTWGAFRIVNTIKDDFIFDGLSFELEDSANWFPDFSSYGHITFYGSNPYSGLTIRNCNFDMAYAKMNGISGYEEDALNPHIRIHNNNFTNMRRFGIEVGNFSTRLPDGSLRKMTDIRIHNNSFSHDTVNTGGFAISFVGIRGGVGTTGVKDGTENYIYNNTFTNVSTILEIGNTSGVYVYNNVGTGATGYLILNEGNSENIEGTNFVYNNNLKGDTNQKFGAKLLFRNGLKDEVYNNFFGGQLLIQDTLGGRDCSMNIHDNTFVHDRIGIDNAAIYVANTTNGTLAFKNNKIYTNAGISAGLRLAGSATGITIIDNEVYLKSSGGTCVSDDSTGTNTESGTTCETGWTGTFPTKIIK